jgi:twitching motility protein PilT
VAAIDSLLKLVIQSNANELRMGSGKAPRMFQSGAAKPLTMREMSRDELVYVLGTTVLSEERAMLVRRDGQLEFSYTSPEAGVFHVVLTRRARPVGDEPIDLDLVFLHGPRGGAKAGAGGPAAGPAAPAPAGPGAPAGAGAPGPAGASAPVSGGAGGVGGAGQAASTARQAGPLAGVVPDGNDAPSDQPAARRPPGGAHEPVRTTLFDKGAAAGTTAAADPHEGHPGEPAASWAGGGPSAGAVERPIDRAIEPDPPISPSPELAALIAQAGALRASDLHLCSGERPFVRIDGRLSALGDEPFASLEPLLEGCLGPGARRRLGAGRSVDLSATAPGVGRFRLNVYRASAGLAAAVRLLPAHAPTLGELSLPFALDDLIELPHGLIVVCGPTGSGKSSTLAALAQEALRRRSIVLVSLEDPIEYHLSARGRASLVRQRQIGRDVADFPTGLRDALREDPDVMLIGEMRDPETIGLALTAAETGHLVLASLHSRSAPSAVERIVDAYPPERQQQIRVQLADALRAVVAQRLLPRARGGGRVPALEVMRVSHSVASLIREGKTAQMATAIQSGRREGMVPLERCLVDMIRAGQVTEAAARAVANDVAALSGYGQG